jgi:hypothetical protein
MKPAANNPNAGPNAGIVAQLRSVRIVHGVLSAVVVSYILIAEKLTNPNGVLSAAIPLSFGIIAFVDVMIIYGFRRKLLPSAIEDLRQNPQNAGALLQWRKAQILTAVLLVIVALLGLMLRVMGGSFFGALPFYLMSLVMLLVWRPREAVVKAGGTIPDSSGN